MKQFLLPGSYDAPARVTLGAGDAHYLLRVLRLQEGDSLPAVDARGARCTLTIERALPTGCVVTVTPAPATAAADPGGGESPGGAARITLLQCLPKGRKIDLIVRQATEAGVVRIIPLVSAHTVVRVGEDDARLSRLRRVAREAVQQSGVPALPTIEEPRELASIARSGEDWGTALLFHEQPVHSEPLHVLLADRPRAVSVLIGPEGGLSEEEVTLLRDAGFRAVHLDAGVLRVETAATFALGAVMIVLQERNAWKPALLE